MKRLNIISFVTISILGTLFHFVYEWSGNNKIVGYFTAVNESTWEHLKLLFFPSIIYFIFEYFVLKNKVKNFIPATVIGIISGLITIIILFYSYSGVLGYKIDFINILIFYIGVAVMVLVRSIIIKNKLFTSTASNIIFIILTLLIMWDFIIYTYSPPSLALFTPPMEK